jgi:hypothetical protein
MGKSLEAAHSSTALKTIASKSVDQVVKELREQGIGSLEDLAKAVVSTAKSASRGSAVAFDPEMFPVCYKFTTARPHFSDADIKNFTAGLKQLLR